jgi:hypothetical protein
MTYPTKLRKGDRIKLNGWSAEWDGCRVIGGCGERLTPADVRREYVEIRFDGYDCNCISCTLECIAEQLVAEGAL